MFLLSWIGSVVVLIVSTSLPALAQFKVKFPISISSKSLGYGPMFAAVKLGFMEREGLEGQVVVVRGADKSLSALMGGSVYVSASGTDAHIAAVERGIDLLLIGGTINGLSQVIMAPKNFKTLNALRGATIGATSATSGLGVALRRYMKAKGFELGRDYQILATGSDASINMEGLNTSTQIYWESSQSKGPAPNAAKYVDQSFIKEAMKDLSAR